MAPQSQKRHNYSSSRCPKRPVISGSLNVFTDRLLLLSADNRLFRSTLSLHRMHNFNFRLISLVSDQLIQIAVEDDRAHFTPAACRVSYSRDLKTHRMGEHTCELPPVLALILDVRFVRRGPCFLTQMSSAVHLAESTVYLYLSRSSVDIKLQTYLLTY